MAAIGSVQITGGANNTNPEVETTDIALRTEFAPADGTYAIGGGAISFGVPTINSNITTLTDQVIWSWRVSWRGVVVRVRKLVVSGLGFTGTITAGIVNFKLRRSFGVVGNYGGSLIPDPYPQARATMVKQDQASGSSAVDMVNVPFAAAVVAPSSGYLDPQSLSVVATSIPTTSGKLVLGPQTLWDTTFSDDPIDMICADMLTLTMSCPAITSGAGNVYISGSYDILPILVGDGRSFL